MDRIVDIYSDPPWTAAVDATLTLTETVADSASQARA